MTTPTIPDDVRAYLGAVRARLDDLPADERDDLLADVEPSILVSAHESDAPIALRLGPPHAFADELRAAAGLPPRVESVSRPQVWERLAAFASTRLRWLRELAPLWWVLRGVVAVGLLELLFGHWVVADDGYVLPVLAVVAAVAVSIALGLRHRRRSALVIIVNVALVLAIAPVAVRAVEVGQAALRDEVVFVGVSAPAGLVYDGDAVNNVYPFDRQGRLLQDVRLYDQFGRPLEVGGGVRDPLRRTVRTRTGKAALNAFPIRYFEPGTRRVADPAAGSPRRPSAVTTKPLD